jgi:hypothetical protein
VTCQASPDDGVGGANPNAGTYKNIGINDHSHGHMVSNSPPVANGVLQSSRLGFLDGQAGTAFHWSQGFWYRYLVDAKVAEVQRYMREQDVDVVVAMERVLGVRVEKSE